MRHAKGLQRGASAEPRVVSELNKSFPLHKSVGWSAGWSGRCFWRTSNIQRPLHTLRSQIHATHRGVCPSQRTWNRAASPCRTPSCSIQYARWSLFSSGRSVAMP